MIELINFTLGADGKSRGFIDGNNTIKGGKDLFIFLIVLHARR